MRARAGKGRKTNKTKKRTKSARPARSKTAKTKTRKAVRSRATKSPARKKAARKAAPRKTPPRKAATAKSRRTPRRKPAREIFGEGNYTASREFREDQTGFVRRNKNRIRAMGEQAEAALDGKEGADLEAAEDRARSRSHSPGDER
jgi:hypothetical protein